MRNRPDVLSEREVAEKKDAKKRDAKKKGTGKKDGESRDAGKQAPEKKDADKVEKSGGRNEVLHVKNARKWRVRIAKLLLDRSEAVAVVSNPEGSNPEVKSLLAEKHPRDELREKLVRSDTNARFRQLQSTMMVLAQDF